MTNWNFVTCSLLCCCLLRGIFWWCITARWHTCHHSFMKQKWIKTNKHKRLVHFKRWVTTEYPAFWKAPPKKIEMQEGCCSSLRICIASGHVDIVPSAGYSVVKLQVLQAFTDCHCGNINRLKYTNKTHFDCGNDCAPVSFPREARHLFYERLAGNSAKNLVKLSGFYRSVEQQPIFDM